MSLAPLTPGDIVDVVAPASRCSDLELRQGIAELRSLGLTPRVPKNLFSKSKLFSNSDEERLKQLRQAVYASDSKMIWCVRGGYGALRLMPQIQKWTKPKQAKIFLGFSDITTLHVHMNQVWNWPTFYGPHIDRLGRGDCSEGEKRQLMSLIFAAQTQAEFKSLQPLNALARRLGKIKAPVLGGTLAVLQSGLGTPSSFRGQKCILFFEDVGERPHRVDRMLNQGLQAGWFKSARAVVLGHFQLGDPKDRQDLWTDVMARFAAQVRIPVLRGLPVGHDSKKQYTLPLNTDATLSLGPRPSLIVTSGICAR